MVLHPARAVALISQVADLPLTGVNPGVADQSRWQRAAFKGGSEPGVMNLTTRLTAADGTTYCVTATWNRAETAIDETQMLTLYGGLLSALQQGKVQQASEPDGRR